MAPTIKLQKAAPLKVSCQQCSLSNLCLPLAVDEQDLDRLENVIEQGRIYSRGEYVFEQNSPFRSCIAVRSGAIKTTMVTENGDEQVTGFYLPGELVGLDSLSSSKYACSAKALDRTSVCELPADQLEELSHKLPGLQHHFFHLMSQEIQNSHQLALMLSKRTAEERIASLLLSLSSRFQRRRLSPTHFQLPMARNDIANFLGLAVETVSRVFTRFQQQRLLTARGREVELLDVNALRQIAQEASDDKPCF